MIGAVAAAALVLVWAFLHEQRAAIPPDFRFQSQFSRQEAGLFYAKARQEQSYWNGICGNLRKKQFKYAWQRLTNGQGHIDGVLTNNNADVLACVRFRNGKGYWITVKKPGEEEISNFRSQISN
jgi:hypothetical protein